MIEVNATSVPIVWKYRIPAPTRNVTHAEAKRPTEVENAKALARHSVGYRSGSQMGYITKLAPPRWPLSGGIRSGHGFIPAGMPVTW